MEELSMLQGILFSWMDPPRLAFPPLERTVFFGVTMAPEPYAAGQSHIFFFPPIFFTIYFCRCFQARVFPLKKELP